MNMWSPILILLFISSCQATIDKSLAELIESVNKEVEKFNAVGAEIEWKSSINPEDPFLPSLVSRYQKIRLKWHHSRCNELATLMNRQRLNETLRRQVYLLCRGPKYTFEEAKLISNTYEVLQKTYAYAKVCIPKTQYATSNDMTSIEDAILDYASDVDLFGHLNHSETRFIRKVRDSVFQVHKMNKICLKGERDFQDIMTYSRKERVLRWVWSVWRDKVGTPMKEPFKELVNIENRAIFRSHSSNLGVSWREEIEMPNLRKRCHNLYFAIEPFYKLLHAVVRFALRNYYGDIVPARGSIPAHLLGDLWSQNWEPLADIILQQNIDFNQRMKELHVNVKFMVKRAEDFYRSLGLPPMTKKFWQKSVFQRKNKNTRCHGSAADMFQDGDYRLLYCSGTSFDDFYVLHHELGHIQYFMAYAHQPAIFRQANSVLHESIGDAIMNGVLTPQHLNRLGLINDTLLYTYYIETEDKSNEASQEEFDFLLLKPERNLVKDDNYINQITNNKIKKSIKERAKIMKYNFIDRYRILKARRKKASKLLDLSPDLILIFKQALNRIPQIPFGLVIDEYRWRYFEGDVKENEENKVYWDLVEELQGIAPFERRGEQYFDVGAKFHVIDNTPYIRYFLSSFLQHQIFEKLCFMAVYGYRTTNKTLPESFNINRCDIYGSRAAGKLLKDIMSRGHSQHWKKILQATINESNITAAALLRYYAPLIDVLKGYIHKYNIPVGW